MKCAKRHQQQEKNLDYLSEGFTATLAMGCFAHIYDDDVVPGWKRKGGLCTFRDSCLYVNCIPQQSNGNAL